MASILRNLSYGIYVVSSKLDSSAGCIANSITQITSNPKIVSISINHDNYTNEIIKKTNTFAVSILSEKVDPNIIGTFGFKSSKDIDKFANIEYEYLDGNPVVMDSIGAFSCKVINTIETPTHTIFLGEVTDEKNYKDEVPMTYKYYRETIKGNSPKNAPTYEEESSKGVTVWRCPVCGYEIEIDELPEDFKCPICGVGMEEFIKIKR